MSTTAKQLTYKLRAVYEGNRDIKQLNKDLESIGKIEAIKRLGVDIRTLSTRFDESKKNLTQQAAAMKKADTITKEMESSYKAAQRQVSRLSDSLEKKKESLRKASTAAKDLGVNTSKLADEEKRLSKVVSANGKVLAARTTLGLKSNNDLKSEVQGLDKAYLLLKNSGTATTEELFIAKQKLKQKTAELTKQNNIWAASYSKVQRGAVALASVGFGLVKAFQEFSAFETGMAEVSTLLDVSEEKFKAFKETAKETMAELPQASGDLTKSLYDILSASVPLHEANKVLEQSARAAVAGVTETKVAVTAGVGAMNAYGLSVEDLDEIYDTFFMTVKKGVTTFPELAQSLGEILPGARAAGVALPEVSAAIAALTRAGIKTPQAATALKGAIRAMAAPAPDAKKKFDLLGITWKGLLPTLEQIAEKGLSIDQMRLLIPDVEASTGVLSLTQNLDQFKKILISMEDAGGSMEKAYDKIADTPQHDIDLMKKSFSDLGKSIGGLASTILLPAAKAIESFVSTLNNSGTVVKTITALIGGSVSAIVLWKLGVGDIVTGVVGMGKKFNTLADAVGLYSGAVALAKTATASLITLVKGNPVLATVSGVALAAAAAWALLGNNSLEASEKHGEAAKKIGEGREEIDKEIRSLIRLQQIFNTANPGTERFTEAERKLAEILPDANTSLDDHGRFIAKVGDSAAENTVKLDRYLEKLREESRLNLALQIEQQVQAYTKAETALQKYKDNLANWYGIGGDGGWAASIWRGVNKLTGTYEKNIQKGEEVRGNLGQQKQAYDKLLTSMKKIGISSDDLSTALDKIHISAELKSQVINSYNNLKVSIEKVTTAANDSAIKQYQAFQKAASNIKGEYVRLASEVKGILHEIHMEEATLGSELRSMQRSIMTPIQAWKDIKKEADEYYSAAETAAEAGDFVEAKRLLGEAKTLYKSLNTEVKDGKKVILSHEQALNVAMAGTERASKKIVEVLNAQNDATVSQMDDLASKAGPFAEMWSGAFNDFLEKGKSTVASLEKELDRLVEDRSLTLSIKTVEQKQSGGLIGLRMRVGGMVEPQRLATGGSVRALNGLSGLALSGYGGGDRRHVLAEDGEVMLKKESVKLAGVKAALAFNAGRFDVVVQELMSRFDIPGTIRRNMGGIINSTPALASTGTPLTTNKTINQGNNDYKFDIRFKGTPQSLSDRNYVRQLTRVILGDMERMHRNGSK